MRSMKDRRVVITWKEEVLVCDPGRVNGDLRDAGSVLVRLV